HVLRGTATYIHRHPEAIRPSAPAPRPSLHDRMERLNVRVMELPDKLHRDFFAVLEASKRKYLSSRIIVWTAALTVLAMLGGLAALSHRWVLYPVRLLHRGVRRVAGGSFDYKIVLRTGDEMQA